MALRTLQPPIPCAPKPSQRLDCRPSLRLSPPIAAAGGRVSGRGFRCSAAAAGGGGREAPRRWSSKRVDLATLGNLCVDIVLNVPALPPAPVDERRAYMERLAASPPDKKYWEAGGNCNLAIAAARLGLHCVTLGHVGDETYGRFLLDVLEDEGIDMVGINETPEALTRTASYETLICWVLVDPFQRHGFCSRADFSEDPALSWMTELSEVAKMAIQQCKILLCNGYAFDDLLPELIVSALGCAIDSGTTIFFDPGPRGRKLFNGMPVQRRALEQFLKLSDVLLLTADEAESLTGITNPLLAGQELIKKGIRTKWVIVKMGYKGSILITKSSISCAPAFKVNIVDTVGCGDSFTSAVAFGFLHDMPPVKTLALANAVGAATATGCGAGRNVADLSKVVEILTQSHLNEDDEYWIKLTKGNVEAQEVVLLSKAYVNGCEDHLVRVPLRNVVTELLHKFEPLCDSMVMQS